MNKSSYEDQNVNTINIPKIKCQKDGVSNKSNLDLNNSQIINQIFYKLSIKNEEKNIFLSQEFDEIVRQIIQKDDEAFLQGGANIIEYLILKYSGSDSDDVKDISTLSLRVKKDFGMLNEFGKYLTNIKELTLTGSGIHYVTDIGSSFVNLISLNISNCNLTDLTGKL